MYFSKCPRCGDQAYEMLRTHDYCASCNYSAEFYAKPQIQIPKWAFEIVGNPEKQISQAQSIAATESFELCDESEDERVIAQDQI